MFGISELLGILRILSSTKISNSILKTSICKRIIFCDTSIENGYIHLKIRKGLFPYPRELSFEIPPYAEITKDGKTVVTIKIVYDDEKGFLCFVNCSNLGSNQEVHNIQLRYKRMVTDEEINNCIEVTEINLPDGKQVTVKNKSEIELMNYLVKCRMPLPHDIILNSENHEDTSEEIIKVYADAGGKIKISRIDVHLKLGSVGSSSAINLQGDVSWYIDLAPMEGKKFILCDSVKKN